MAGCHGAGTAAGDVWIPSSSMTESWSQWISSLNWGLWSKGYRRISLEGDTEVSFSLESMYFSWFLFSLEKCDHLLSSPWMLSNSLCWLHRSLIMSSPIDWQWINHSYLYGNISVNFCFFPPCPSVFSLSFKTIWVHYTFRKRTKTKN